MTPRVSCKSWYCGALLGACLVVAASPARIDAAGGAGVISTVAGGPGWGPPLTVAQQPTDIAVGAGGAVYLTDPSQGVVRRIDGTPPRERVAAGVGARSSSAAQPFTGDGGPPTLAALSPLGLTVDRSGDLVIADTYDQRIRVVAATTGTMFGVSMTAGDIYTVAGTGAPGRSGDGGPATSARLKLPGGVALDPGGNLVIADTYNNRIRVVAATTATMYGVPMTGGRIYTVAGDGTKGFSGDGGPATAAALRLPAHAVTDAAGNTVIADTGNQRIRVVAATTGTHYGLAMTAGDIYTVAGTGVRGFSGDGAAAALAQVNAPAGVAVDTAGNLLVADEGNERMRVLATTTGAFYGQQMTAGDIYSLTAGLTHPTGVAVDATGNVLVADESAFAVRVVAQSTGTFYGVHMTPGITYTVAGVGHLLDSGDGRSATGAELGTPYGAAVDANGNLLIASDGVRAVAASTGTFYGVAMTAGDIYRVAGGGTSRDDGIPATSAAISVEGLALDHSGNVVVTDFGGLVRVVATTTGTFYGVTMTAGDIYTVAGGGTGGLGDGGPARSASFGPIYGVAVDPIGNLVINDNGDYRVRVVAATTGSFYGVAMTAGDVYTVAGTGRSGFSGDGGPAIAAEVDLPFSLGVTSDAAGNILVADQNNHRVRAIAGRSGTFYGIVMTVGHIYTVAGGGSQPADGVPARSALLSPDGLVVDSAGNVVIADEFRRLVRVVASRTGTFYGVPMTAGDIYTVAGGGDGRLGDGGPATAATVAGPTAVALDGSGNLYSTEDARVREVRGP